jgi:hypothetical protein
VARQRGTGAGGPRRPRRRCYQWMYSCIWEDSTGKHIAYKLHGVLRPDATNYQGASAQARREVLANLERYVQEIIRAQVGVRFYCRREGPIVEVPGPC